MYNVSDKIVKNVLLCIQKILEVNILSNIELGQLFTVNGISEKIQIFA